jgi:hypothetical protein
MIVDMRFLLGLFFCLGIGKIVRAEVCPQGQYLVREHFRKGYVRVDGISVSSANVKQHCRPHTKVSEYLLPLFKLGIPPNWPNRSEKLGAWTEAERERLLDVLENLPGQLLTKKLVGFYRLRKSKDYPNPATSAEGIIVLYDSAFDSSRDLGRIVAHELVHQHFREFKSEDGRSYRRATGWHLKLGSDRKIYWEGRESGYVEEDGKNSFEEDYANNVECYLFDPNKLKKITPSAYEWIKKYYGSNFELKGVRK